jgi:ribose/xylose/arabinose/galactoside ABC-type transport system permease subunit
MNHIISQSANKSLIKLKKLLSNNIISKYGVYIFLFLLIVILSLMTDSFLSTRNIINVLRQISINAVLAFGMTFVIISGGIDLSVASTVALSGVLATSFAHPGDYPLFIPILIALAIGSLVGLVNGGIISRTGIPPFIVTLGLMQVARGFAFIYTKGTSVINLSESYKFIGQGSLFGVPFPIFILVIVFIICYFVLHKTKFGRHVYAVGGNSLAAKVSGVSITKIRTLVYMISGLLAGLVGLVLTSRTNSGNPNAAFTYELDAIAAVVIGGTSMTGGKGTMVGTLIGAMLIGIINNGLDLINVSSYTQQVVKGVIIIGALLIDRLNEKKL